MYNQLTHNPQPPMGGRVGDIWRPRARAELWQTRRMDERLSRIETLWSVVQQAHGDDELAAQRAQQKLMDQYGGAVKRYLLGCLRNDDAADEVFQEFALRFVRGDFRNANAERGRFRSFVKTAIYHLIVDYQRRSQRDRKNRDLQFDCAEEQDQMLERMDEEFTASWRSELLAKTWSSLEQKEAETGKPHYTVLRFRADHPELRSPELAAELTKLLARPINAGNVRVLIHRAREVFADMLVANVEASLESPTRDTLENELIALDLLSYCKPTLTRRRGGNE